MLSPYPSARSCQRGGRGWTPVPRPGDGAGWGHTDSTVPRVQDFCPKHFQTEGQTFLSVLMGPFFPSCLSILSPCPIPLHRWASCCSPQAHSSSRPPPAIDSQHPAEVGAKGFAIPASGSLLPHPPDLAGVPSGRWGQGGAAGSGTCCPQTTPRQGMEAASRSMHA